MSSAASHASACHCAATWRLAFPTLPGRGACIRAAAATRPVAHMLPAAGTGSTGGVLVRLATTGMLQLGRRDQRRPGRSDNQGAHEDSRDPREDRVADRDPHSEMGGCAPPAVERFHSEPRSTTPVRRGSGESCTRRVCHPVDGGEPPEPPHRDSIQTHTPHNPATDAAIPTAGPAPHHNKAGTHTVAAAITQPCTTPSPHPQLPSSTARPALRPHNLSGPAVIQRDDPPATTIGFIRRRRRCGVEQHFGRGHQPESATPMHHRHPRPFRGDRRPFVVGHRDRDISSSEHRRGHTGHDNWRRWRFKGPPGPPGDGAA